MQTISPCLWFDTQAEEAANFYVSIFKNSRIVKVSRYGDSGPGVPGSAIVVEFELDGQRFQALNGGPQFQFTEAISLSISVDTQEDLDYFWTKLTDGGAEGQCGWLKDRYGLSWQVVPTVLGELMCDPEPARSKRVMEALFAMKKLDINILREAYERTA